MTLGTLPRRQVAQQALLFSVTVGALLLVLEALTPAGHAQKDDRAAATSRAGRKGSKADAKTTGGKLVHPVTKRSMIFVPSRVVNSRHSIMMLRGAESKLADGSLVVLRSLPLFRNVVTGFFMDEREVTNADYLRFVDAKNAPMPQAWSGQRPVGEALTTSVQVRNDEAQAYAQWAGLSLPMLEEFLSATADSTGVYPWPDAPVGSAHSTSTGAADISPLGFRDLVAGAPEWGSTVYKGPVETRLAFRLDKPFPDNEGTVTMSVSQNVALGVRCVDRVAGVNRVIADAAALGAAIQSLTDKHVERVLIDHKGPAAELTLSDGTQVSLGNDESRQVLLLPGSYFVFVATPTDPRTKQLFFMQVPELGGRSTLTWTLSAEGGTPLQ